MSSKRRENRRIIKAVEKVWRTFIGKDWKKKTIKKGVNPIMYLFSKKEKK